jgi:hypothetical protein
VRDAYRDVERKLVGARLGSSGAEQAGVALKQLLPPEQMDGEGRVRAHPA